MIVIMTSTLLSAAAESCGIDRVSYSAIILMVEMGIWQ